MVVIAVALANYFLRDKDDDANPQKKRRIRIVTAFYVIGSVVGAVVMFVDDSSSKASHGEIASLNQKLDTAAINADTLIQELDQTHSLLALFLSEAVTRYPGLDSLTALRTLANDLHVLKGRVDTLQGSYSADRVARQSSELLKHTPPRMEVKLGLSKDGKYAVKIRALNVVPFEARWVVVNRSGRTAAFMPVPERFFPTKDPVRWISEVVIDSSDLVDDYVRLEFHFQSIYFEEMGRPDSLQGDIIQEYRLVDNVPQPW